MFKNSFLMPFFKIAEICHPKKKDTYPSPKDDAKEIIIIKLYLLKKNHFEWYIQSLIFLVFLR
jgi:hypothetical protein